MPTMLIYTVLSFFLGNSTVIAHPKHSHIQPAHSQAEKHSHVSAHGQKTIRISLIKQEDLGAKKLIQIKLTKIKDGQPVTLNDLKEVHTEKVHLLIIDDSLSDYHHIHPKALEEAGVYQFE